MSDGLDNIGDLLDDPGYKSRRGGGGGRLPGTGGPGIGGPAGGSGGFLGGQTLGGANVASPGVRRRLPGGWGAAIPQPDGSWRRLGGDEIGWLFADHIPDESDEIVTALRPASPPMEQPVEEKA